MEGGCLPLASPKGLTPQSWRSAPTKDIWEVLPLNLYTFYKLFVLIHLMILDP